jgi:hypothetical protein
MKLLDFFQLIFIYVNHWTMLFHTHGDEIYLGWMTCVYAFFHDAAPYSFLFPSHSLLDIRKNKHVYLSHRGKIGHFSRFLKLRAELWKRDTKITVSDIFQTQLTVTTERKNMPASKGLKKWPHFAVTSLTKFQRNFFFLPRSSSTNCNQCCITQFNIAVSQYVSYIDNQTQSVVQKWLKTKRKENLWSFCWTIRFYDRYFGTVQQQLNDSCVNSNVLLRM